MAECKKEQNLKDCPCTYPGYPRRGRCHDCLRHHQGKGELRTCFFSEEVEKTFDRSIENFIRGWQKN